MNWDIIPLLPTYIIQLFGFFHIEVTLQDKDQDY